MYPSSIHKLAARAASHLVARGARSVADELLRQPTLVIAPHPDDETLGCGGTIARKAELGVEVWVAFLTDGRHSHPVPDPAELGARRRREARDAMEQLGIDPRHLYFLEFIDGALESQLPACAAAISDLLRRLPVRQVFTPYLRDPHPDHAAASRSTIAAAARAGRMLTVFEYPVWFWDDRPWVEWPETVDSRTTPTARYLLRNVGRALRDLRSCVDVRPQRSRKQSALDAYATQMSPQTPEWWTLADASNGQLLARLVGPREFFRVRARGRLV